MRSLWCLVLFFTTIQVWSQRDWGCWVFIKKQVPFEEHLFVGEKLGESDWFHAYSSYVSLFEKGMLEQTPEVDSVVCEVKSQVHVELSSIPLTYEPTDVQAVLEGQVNRMQGQLFAQKNLDGSGVTVAVLDAGFKGLKNATCLSHLFREHRIVGTYDFVNKNKGVEHTSVHGTEVLSCLAGIHENQNMGCATGSNYLLIRAEQNESERLIRETRWVNALEWAVAQGAQIVTSSLIYSDQLYKRTEMTGKVSLLSLAADKAFERGVLVLNSAGNAGDKRWEIIGAPGDAQHVICVGGIDPAVGCKASFSSMGPTHDGRLKPELCAFGYAVVANQDNIEINGGTSFACPLVAGFVACVKQMHPEWNAVQLKEELFKSADLYPYFDYAHGYGVPQAMYFMAQTHFLSEGLIQPDEFEVVIERDEDTGLNETSVTFNLKEALDSTDYFTWNDQKPLLYTHVQRLDGRLSEYMVFLPDSTRGGQFYVESCPGCILRAYYRKQWKEIKLP